MKTKVWRQVEITLLVDVMGDGEPMTANVLYSVEAALKAGCEYAPQQMCVQRIRTVAFGEAWPVFNEPLQEQEREADLAELVRLEAKFGKVPITVRDNPDY